MLQQEIILNFEFKNRFIGGKHTTFSIQSMAYDQDIPDVTGSQFGF
jgi:hypothetical protein